MNSYKILNQLTQDQLYIINFLCKNFKIHQMSNYNEYLTLEQINANNSFIFPIKVGLDLSGYNKVEDYFNAIEDNFKNKFKLDYSTYKGDKCLYINKGEYYNSFVRTEIKNKKLLFYFTEVEHSLFDLPSKHIKQAYKCDGELILELDNKIMLLQPVGECCANCYVQSVCFSEALIDATVFAVEELNVKKPKDDDFGNTIDCWGYRIVTNKGICNIEMRVSHSGSYSGSLDIHYIDNIPDNATKLVDFC